MGMKDAFLFGLGRGTTRSGFLLLTLDRPVLYTGTMVQEYRSNRNVFFACHYHALWCPKYRRKVLVGPIEARLKQIIADVCQEHQADIEELEVLPDHVHLLVNVDPQYGIHRLMKLIKGRSSRLLRARVCQPQAHIAHLVDECVFCLDDRRSASLDHQTVHRTAKICLTRRTNTGSI